jgi:transglutaminase-like putative cysteine protease
MQLSFDAPQAAYLKACTVMDFGHPEVLNTARRLRATNTNPTQTAQSCFEFVRDEIDHSWDARRGPVTLCASEVLLHRSGFCYAKSHLLAALLRANSIPAGLCYQRLSVNGAGAPYCLHGLNALWLEEFGWFRVDARGNKPGVAAQFAPPAEHLAFPITAANECDFPMVFAQPHPAIITALTQHPDIASLYAGLPDIETLKLSSFSFPIAHTS